MSQNLPSGTVTFLFTDIEGSTKLWEKYPVAMKSALAAHDEVLREAIESNHGHVIKTTGDGVHAVFATAIDAVNASIDAQHAFQTSEVFKTTEVPLPVRMGMHTGEAQLRDNDYFGGTLNRAARIMGVAYGGQILLSAVTAALAHEHLPENTSLLDLGEHRLKNLSRLENIFQLNAPGLPSDFPQLKSLNAQPNNLPFQLTSFIGRERELTEATKRIENVRLLTLIGPGGTGKTRLSVQLGTNLLEAFRDGVWLVELAPISDPLLVMQTVASAFDIHEISGMPLKTLVHDYLREKQLLLILDNCEHLVETSAKIADEFLHVAANIKIIASSREALGINGETVYRVPSLSLPEQAEVTKDAALGYESVQLFVDRASAANPKFQLADENASSVAQICSRLDGIPLAIELAASRITVFSPEQIAKRLDDRFKLLTGGSRTALPRQQTLRALIDWSYDLLSEDERAFFRRISVFSGGWTFEAAETICSNLDVFEHLLQLINKSLVVVNDEGDEPRYYLLETIRQYARDKLLENEEGEGTRDRHLAYYLEMAETAQPKLLQRAHELEWLERLETEYDNIRTAVEWGLSKDPFAAMRMVSFLLFFMMTKSHSGEGRRWGMEALRQIDDERSLTAEENKQKGRLFASLSILSFSMGDNPAAIREADQALTLLRPINDKWYLALTLGFRAAADFLTGNADTAIDAMDEATKLAEEVGDKYALGAVLSSSSRVEAFARGDFAKAYAIHERACELLKEHGNRWTYAITLYGLGNIAIALKDFETAREKFNLAMQIMQELGSKRNVAMIQSDLAHILRYEGKYPEAMASYRGTIREWQRIGHRAAVAHQLESVAFISKALEQTSKALRLFGAAEALREKIEIDMTSQEREAYEREIADFKANIDKNELASLWTEGRSMTMEEAIELVLDDKDA